MAYGKGKKRKTKPGSRRTAGLLATVLSMFTSGPVGRHQPMSYPTDSRPNQRQRRKRARWIASGSAPVAS